MKTTIIGLKLTAATSVLALVSPVLVNAQVRPAPSSSHTIHSEKTVVGHIESYWTPERLRSAKSRDLFPESRLDGLPLTASVYTDQARSGEVPVKVSGAPPTLKANADLRKVLVPSSAEGEKTFSQENASPIVPDATSETGAQFTTSRVFPDAATNTFPYSTAGKLFFQEVDPSGADLGFWQCSASVLRPRVIVTAGHCVTHPSSVSTQRYFFRNFLFIPAYNDGVAPFGSWTPNGEVVSNAWYLADEDPFVSNPQDVAMLVAADQKGIRLGDYTGRLGYATNSLGSNDVTMLGYPVNLDSGQRMEVTFAQEFQSGGNNTYIYGSAMRGGASGGPWIQDFGVSPSGAPAGLLGNNWLVGVTSFGPTATGPKYLGASNLDQRFLDVLAGACGAATTGNCN